MTRPRDLVGLATGDVRVSVSDLNIEERLRLFGTYTRMLGEHYGDGHKGGSSFLDWHTENFGKEFTRHSVRRFSLTIDSSLYPQEKEYNKNTRIVSLTGDYFHLPEFKEPKNGDWKLGDIKLVTRLCVTNAGRVYLEWYEGRITKMYKEHPTMPEKVLVTNALYIYIPMFFFADGYPEKLSLLLEKHPGTVLSYGLQILSLIKREADERTRRAARDMDFFVKLNNMGRIFHITHP